MADGKKQITGFLRRNARNVGISSLVLVVLEKIMDNDFVCPCQPGYNEWICACYAVVPFAGCVFFTVCFVDSGPESHVQRSSIYDKLLVSLLIAFIWLFLFFFDGRYVSCACSRWGGEYTESGLLKWCRPTGNDTLVLMREQETHRCITISQVSSQLDTENRTAFFSFFLL